VVPANGVQEKFEKMYQVRRAKVEAAINCLIKINPYYAAITLDVDALAEIPDGPLGEVCADKFNLQYLLDSRSAEQLKQSEDLEAQMQSASDEAEMKRSSSDAADGDDKSVEDMVVDGPALCQQYAEAVSVSPPVANSVSFCPQHHEYSDKSVDQNTCDEILGGLSSTSALPSNLPLPRIAAPVLSEQPISELSSPGILSKCFPHLFPYGTGDFSASFGVTKAQVAKLRQGVRDGTVATILFARNGDISPTKYMQHLMRFADGRFAQDQRYALFQLCLYLLTFVYTYTGSYVLSFVL
jgi:hypothetical protein